MGLPAVRLVSPELTTVRLTRVDRRDDCANEANRAAAEAARPSPVAKAKPSPAARRKANTKRTDDGLPVPSLRSLLADLATLTRNTVRFGRDHTTTLLATPTELQSRACQLLDVQPAL